MASTSEAAAIKKVLDRLRGALGTGEHPANSNHNFITEWYNKEVDRIGDGAWCEMTNTWSTWTGGAKSLKKGRAYTVWATEDAQAKVNGSSWHWGTKGLRAGDQVYYDWSGRKMDNGLVDHTGTVEKIIGDGTFYVLEGNTSQNKLLRMRRDSKYVVGYVRLDWSRIIVIPEPPKPAPPVYQPPADIAKTKRIQKTLEVTVDGQWGTTTDNFAQLMRRAARAKVGYPKRVAASFNIKVVQRIIDTTADGDWGPRSQASMNHWVKEFQKAVNVTVDGDWGPKTDNAYLAARKQNLNRY